MQVCAAYVGTSLPLANHHMAGILLELCTRMPVMICDRPYVFYSTNTIITSFTFVFVGPVIIKSSSGLKKL